MISGSEREGLSKFRALGALAVCATVALFTHVSHAQDPEAVKRIAARELAQQAADAFDGGDYATALDRFTRAQELFPAPTLALMQARALVALGRWVEGYDKYHDIARTRVEPDAPEAFRRAVADAGAEAQQLEAQLPRIELRTPETTGLVVHFDGKPLPNALLNLLHPVDPGAHRISAAIEGSLYFEQTVDLSAQQVFLLEIPPPRSAEATAVVAPEPPEPPPVHRPQERDAVDHSERPPWLIPTAFTVGGLGVATAVTSLLLASGPKSNLDEVCTPGCPPSAADDLDSFRLYRKLFFVGSAVGVVGSALGVYFVLTAPSDSSSVAVGLTPGGVDLSGRF